jgi:hypothetical protein
MRVWPPQGDSNRHGEAGEEDLLVRTPKMRLPELQIECRNFRVLDARL